MAWHWPFIYGRCIKFARLDFIDRPTGMSTRSYFFFVSFSSSSSSFSSSSSSSSSPLLLHDRHHNHEELQLRCLKFLAQSRASFHVTLSWMHFVQLFIFITLKSSCLSFSCIMFGRPANPVDVGLHSCNLLAILSFAIRCTRLKQLNLRALM